MRTILFISLMILSLTGIQAQTLSRQVIGTTGSANPQLSYTVGETVVQTAISGSFVLTQGFQQPDQLAVNNQPGFKVDVSYKLYPNPSHDWMILELNSDQYIEVKLDIIDMAGRSVQNDIDMKGTGTHQKKFDVSDFASGSYLMRIKSVDGKFIKTLKFERLD